jgi:hypothetical protein
MMKERGFDFDEKVPLHLKYGVLCKKTTAKFENERCEYVRTKDYNFSTNLIEQDRVKTLELFFDTRFSEKIETEMYVM